MKINFFKKTPTSYFFSAIFIMLFSSYYFPILQFNIFPYNFLGILPIIWGIGTLMIARLLFIVEKTTIEPDEVPEKLLTKKIYSKTRNPMYLSLLVILFGFSMIFSSLSSFLVIPLYFLFLDRFIIPKEEEKLFKIFGSLWIKYSLKVNRWIGF